MIKVLWFSPTPCGSVNRNKVATLSGGWLISLEDELKQNQGIELHVAFFSDTECEAFDFDGVHYHPMLLKQSKNGIKRVLERRQSPVSIDKKMLPVMLNVVKTVNPDLIHIHGTEERFGQIQDHIKDIPICFSIQGLIASIENKYFTGMSYAEATKYEKLWDKVRNVSIRDDWKSLTFRAKREERYLQHAKYIFGRTFWDENITLAMNPNRKYFVVDEILRTPFYNKLWNKTEFSQDKLKLVSTISGGIFKGFETALETARILKQYSGFDFEWNIVGYDATSKWVHIAEKIKRLKHHDLCINLLGRKDAEELSELLINSDIYVHVSHIENSPNSVCEAMLVGMPVIASYAGGTATLLKDGQEGKLVQDGDPYVLAGTIVNLYQHFDKAQAYAESARKTAASRHDPKRVASQLIYAYKTITTSSSVNHDILCV